MKMRHHPATVRSSSFPKMQLLPHRIREVLQAFPGDSGNRDDRQAFLQSDLRNAAPQPAIRKIHFREGDDLGFFWQLGIERLQFVQQDLVPFLWLVVRAFNEEYEDPCPLDVAQEFYSEPFSFMRSLNKARHVRHDKTLKF